MRREFPIEYFSTRPEGGVYFSMSAHAPPTNHQPDAILLIFLLSPFLLTLGAIHWFFPDPERLLETKAKTCLEEVLGQTEQAGSPNEYFTSLFAQMEDEFHRAPSAQTFWQTSGPAWKKRFPKTMEFVCFDAEFHPLLPYCDRPVPKILSRKFLKEYQGFLTQGKPLSSISQSFIQSFLGPFIPREGPIHGRFAFSQGSPKDQFLYFSRPGENGAFILFFLPKKPLVHLALSDRIEQLSHKTPEVLLASAFHGQTTQHLIRQLRLSGILRQPLWKSLHRSPNGCLRLKSRLLKKASIAPGIWVVGAIAVGPTRWFYHLNTTAILIILGGTILYFPLKGAWMAVPWLNSVRGKMIGAFLYSSVVPLVIMALVAGRFLAERRTVMENEVFHRSENLLISFDRSFQFHLNRLQGDLNSQALIVSDGADPFQVFQKHLPEFQRTLEFHGCRVFDLTGRVVLDEMTGRLTQGGEKIRSTETLLRETLRKITKSDKPNEQTPPTQSPRGSRDFLTNELTLNPFFFYEFDIHGNEILVGGFPFGTAHGITHQAFFVWDRLRTEWKYVEKMFHRFQKLFPNGGFYVTTVLPPYRGFPDVFRFAGDIKPILEKVNSQTRGFQEKRSRTTDSLLISGIRGTVLKRFRLIGVMSDFPISREIKALMWETGFICASVVGICLIIGTLLAGIFIVPIGDLHQGMAALRLQDFSVSIPVHSSDELGKTAEFFNAAKTDLQDLEVAKTVQQSFFPQEAFFSPPWEIVGSTVSASQIGGDYLDFFALDEKRVLITLGDVSGHGVGAALVVGMAKAAMCHPSTHGDPLGILHALHHLLYSVLKRRKMMSCLVGVLNLETGAFFYANAGQTYPLLIGSHGAEFLQSTGLPVGSVKRFQVTSQERLIKPGETLILYTDGLVEAAEKTGGMIGFKRLEQSGPRLAAQTARGTEKAIRSWFSELAGDAKPLDDVTLLIIHRSTAGERCHD
jgi:hypothetical protein